MKSLCGTKVCAMVKADAYGHGLKTVSKTLAPLVDYFGVAHDFEALTLRKEGITTPILIVGSLSNADAKNLFFKNITQAVSNTDELKLLEHLGTVLDKQIKVHIKVDTGMNRLGLKTKEEIDEIASFLASSHHIICDGVFTHFACSDGSDNDFFHLQHSRFIALADRLKAAVKTPLTVHCLSSGGVFLAPNYAHDMVRLGLSLYGYGGQNPEAVQHSPHTLSPVLEATAAVCEVKEVSAGESISYGRSFFAPNPMTVAVIRAGYGDGYKRVLSNKGHCIINGQNCPIVGKICMDMFMADVSKISTQKGDTATLLGEGLTAIDVAQMADTIPYEILTSLKPREGISYKF